MSGGHMISIYKMKQLIDDNGHLVREGKETTAELRQALIYLRCHFPHECQKPHLGINMEILMPDITVLAPNSKAKMPRKARNLKDIHLPDGNPFL